MKKKQFIFLLFMLAITIVISLLLVSKMNDKEQKESTEETYEEISVEQSKFQIYKDDDNILDLNYNGKDINQFMTIVSSNSLLKLKVNFNESYIIDNIYIINKNSGDKISFDNVDEKFASVALELIPDIDYGVIINNSLTGAIRAVKDIEEADLHIIQTDMFLNLKCGL